MFLSSCRLHHLLPDRVVDHEIGSRLNVLDHMALWVDKYRPQTLAELTYHRTQAKQLANIVKSGDFPHLLVSGPRGAGKMTRVFCILNELYGAGVQNLWGDTKTFQTTAGKQLEIRTFSSKYHIQLCPAEVGIYDRVVVQDIIKEMAQMHQINCASNRAFKVVVLMEADELTRDAQNALRRTMEKYTKTCRLILCCEVISKIAGPLRSRCMAIRVGAPSEAAIKSAIRAICEKENVEVPENLLNATVKKAGRNMRRAVLMTEAAKSKSYPFDENQEVPEPEWEIYLRETARAILQEPSAET